MEINSTQTLDLNTAVQYILQFCKENNLQQTFQALASETGVQYTETSNKEEIVESAKKGQWQVVIRHMQYIKCDKEVIIAIYEHIIKELLLEREYSLAQSVIKDQHEVLSQKPDVLQQLWDLSQMREPPHTVQTLFKNLKSLDEIRENLSQLIEQNLSQDELKPNMLLTMLSKGLIYETGGQTQPIQQKVQHQQKQIIQKQGEEIQSKYVQRIVSHKLFQGEFKIQTITVSHNSEYLVLGGQDGLIEVWSYSKMALDSTLPYQQNDLFMLHRRAILSLVFSKDDKILASGDAEGIIRVWKFQEGKRLREIDTQGGETSGIAALLFTSNVSQIIAGCLDKSIRIYGLKSGSLIKHLKHGHESFIQQLQLLPQKDNLLLASSQDGLIILWNLTEQDPKSQLVKYLQTPAQRLNKDLFLNNYQVNPMNGKEVLICHRYRSAHLLNLDTNQVLQEYQSNQSKDEELLFAQFSSDCNFVYCLSSTKNLYIFDKKTAKLISLLLVPIGKEEINGLLVQGHQGQSYESMVMHSLSEMFKLDSEVS